MARGFFGAHLAKVAEQVIVLRPVDQRDVARISALDEQRFVRDTAIGPQSVPFQGRLQLVGLLLMGSL